MAKTGFISFDITAGTAAHQFARQHGLELQAAVDITPWRGERFFLSLTGALSYSSVFYAPKSELLLADRRIGFQAGVFSGFRVQGLGPGGPYDWLFSRHDRSQHKIDLGLKVLGGLQLIDPSEEFHFLKSASMGAFVRAGAVVVFQGEHNRFTLSPLGMQCQRILPNGGYACGYYLNLGGGYEW